jgi:hypothetical protein
MVRKSEDTDPKIPAILVEHPKLTVADFSTKLEALMNEAYQQSLEGEHKHLWAAWCNELGDLWRKVKAHA